MVVEAVQLSGIRKVSLTLRLDLTLGVNIYDRVENLLANYFHRV